MTEILLNNTGIITRIIEDAIAIGVTYTFSFVGCDIIYNDFSLSQSIKSAYWFFLGPFLWKWGTAIPWVFEILKNFVEGKWNSIKSSLTGWVEGLLPSWLGFATTSLILAPVSLVGDLIDADGDDMIDNYEYIKEKRFSDLPQQ